MHPFRRERILRELSQHHCARAASISQTKLSLIELGYRRPSPFEAQKLAEVVDGDAGELFPEDGTATREFKVQGQEVAAR